MAGSSGDKKRGSFAAWLMLRAILLGLLVPLEAIGRDPSATSDRFGRYQEKLRGSMRSDSRAIGDNYQPTEIVGENNPTTSSIALDAATSVTDRYAEEEISGAPAYRKSASLAESSGEKAGPLGIASVSGSTARVLRRSYEIVSAQAGADQLVDGSTVVTLDGSESRGTGSRPVSYQWSQISGPTVGLLMPTVAQTTFNAPPPNNFPIYLSFELTVTQGLLTARDLVHVVVKPVSLAEPASEEQVLQWFSELEPLPKVHYSWPIGTIRLESFNENLLREYARITHSLSVWGEWSNQSLMEKVVAIAGQVNDTGPEIPVTLALVFRPWTRVFPSNAPPTYLGPEHDGEISFFAGRLETVGGWLEEANQARHGNPIEVSAIILECERFFVKREGEPGYEEWNAAIEAKHNAIYWAAKEAFPEARVEWYARGLSDLFTLNEMGDSYSVPLYSAPERAVMRTLFRRTVEAADAAGVDDATPWVALGSSYIPMPDGSKVWSFDYDYSLIYSWHIGAEINDPWYGDRPTQFAPWHAAKSVIFWPAPWEERIPNWPRHFVAYVRGAHNITELPR
jgi:hypothetical protein